MPYDQSMKNRRLGKARPPGNAIEWQPRAPDEIDGAVQEPTVAGATILAAALSV